MKPRFLEHFVEVLYRGAVARSESAFTLIELTVVVVIIGLVASIAVNRFGSSRANAYVSSVKADLRNLALAEESYYYDNGAYAGSLAALGTGGYQSSPGVDVTINEATNAGWSATATHQDTPKQCYLFTEAAAPIGSATTPGNISCT